MLVNMGRVFRQTALQYADVPAVINVERNRRFSYARMHEISSQIFVQGYGSTECWPSVTILGRKDHGTQTREQIDRLLSVGRPMPGEEVIICDADGKLMPAGQHGEIWIRGPNTIQGYYKNPELTRKNFSAGGFWKSGDMGYMDDQGYP